jgi:hypothetical protein
MEQIGPEQARLQELLQKYSPTEALSLCRVLGTRKLTCLSYMSYVRIPTAPKAIAIIYI